MGRCKRAINVVILDIERESFSLKHGVRVAFEGLGDLYPLAIIYTRAARR
jgi:hypothetical protein